MPYSWSLNSEYSSSPTFTGLPPYFAPSISYNFLANIIPSFIAYLWYENLVSWRDTGRNSLALLIKTSRTDSQDFGFVEFLDAALGQVNAAGCFRLSLDSLNEYTI